VSSSFERQRKLFAFAPRLAHILELLEGVVLCEVDNSRLSGSLGCEGQSGAAVTCLISSDQSLLENGADAMTQIIEAIYTNVLKPTEELDLREAQRVRVIVEPLDDGVSTARRLLLA
jgi:hypothetical protein